MTKIERERCERLESMLEAMRRERDAALKAWSEVHAERDAAIKRAEEAEQDVSMLRTFLDESAVALAECRAMYLLAQTNREVIIDQRDRALALLAEWQSEGWSKELHRKTSALLAEVGE